MLAEIWAKKIFQTYKCAITTQGNFGIRYSSLLLEVTHGGGMQTVKYLSLCIAVHTS